jgi:hypothetical protein
MDDISPKQNACPYAKIQKFFLQGNAPWIVHCAILKYYPWAPILKFHNAPPLGLAPLQTPPPRLENVKLSNTLFAKIFDGVHNLLHIEITYGTAKALI